MKTLTRIALIAALAAAAPGAAFAQEARAEVVHFKSGETGATIRGSIKGDEGVRYLVGAAKGQSMAVGLDTDNASTNFNIFAPGTKPGEDQAMFASSASGTEYVGTLPANGDYLIQVFLMVSSR
jgi:hypothetical protein